MEFYLISLFFTEATQTLTQFQKSQPKVTINDSKSKPLAPLQASNLAFANAVNIPLNLPVSSKLSPAKVVHFESFHLDLTAGMILAKVLFLVQPTIRTNKMPQIPASCKVRFTRLNL